MQKELIFFTSKQIKPVYFLIFVILRIYIFLSPLRYESVSFVTVVHFYLSIKLLNSIANSFIFPKALNEYYLSSANARLKFVYFSSSPKPQEIQNH